MNRGVLRAAAAALALAAPAAAHDGVHHDPRLPELTKRQIHAVARAVQPYRDFALARREGWKKFGGDAPLMGEHWYLPRERGGPNYVGRDRIDFTRPSNLMYTDIGGRRVLTGVTFNVRLAPGEPVPEGFAGRADGWHVHDFPKAIAAALQDRPVLRTIANWWIDENFTRKGDTRGRIAMVHAWVTLPNPDGIFADHNRTLPYLKLGLPAAYAGGASLTAAKGLNLATANGCKEQVDGGAWIANVDGRTKKRLNAACAAAAAHVRSALPGRDKAAINRMAEHGWHMFDAQWQRLLTGEQKQRIAAITEHGGGHDSHGAHTAH